MSFFGFLMRTASLWYTLTMRWYINTLSTEEAIKFTRVQLKDRIRIGEESKKILKEVDHEGGIK